MLILGLILGGLLAGSASHLIAITVSFISNPIKGLLLLLVTLWH